MSDKQFIAFQDGSPTALHFYYKRHGVHIKYYLFAMVKDMLIAEQLTEQAFRKLYYSRDQIESPRHLLAFLYYIARKCGRLYLEGSSCADNDEPAIVPPAPELLAIFEDVDVDWIESLNQVLLVIDKLSPKMKEAMEMRLLLKMKEPEIAAQLKRSPHTIRNQIDKALLILRLQLGKGFDRGSLFA